MQALGVLMLLSLLATNALASLEPANYRPPSSLSSSTNTHSPDSSSSSGYFYNPPQIQLRPQKPTAPSTNYLPPNTSEKKQPQQQQHLQPSPSPRPPSSNYLPPLSPIPSPSPPALTTEYLPPARTVSSSGNYLPPVQSSTSRTAAPARSSSSNYPTTSPPATTTSRPQHQHQQQYLPPAFGAGSRQSVPAPVAMTKGPNRHESPIFKPTTSYGEPHRQFSTNQQQAGQRDDYLADNYLPPASSSSSSSLAGSTIKSSSKIEDLDRPSFGYDAAGSFDQPTTESSKYAFEYRVSDEFGNDYAHRESRDGSQTHGFYSVLLPDGRLQRVVYTADEAGFRPQISYEEAATVLGPKTPDVAGYDNNANSLEELVGGTQGPY